MIQKIKRILTAGVATLVLLGAGFINDPNLPIESELYIVIDARTGHVIAGQGIHQQGYPASMTKVMTALLLLESGRPMDEIIFHSEDAINSVVPWHSAIFYNVVDYVTVEQALYSIMLPSANDVSNAIAEHLAGGMDAFALMMTHRARELGAVNTNFTNAHGLWEEAHVTTPYDMALIMREAISHDKFLEIISTQRFFFEAEDDEVTDYHFVYNTNSMIFPTSQFFNPDIVGSKTGFTNQSRHTLVSYGTRRDMHLITVVMLADARPTRYDDTRVLMDYAFGRFEDARLFDASNFALTLDLVQRSDEGILVIGEMDIVPRGNINMPMPLGFNVANIETRIVTPDRIVVPVGQGFVVGQAVMEYNGNIVAEVDLLTTSAADALPLEELAALFPDIVFEGIEPETEPGGILTIIANIVLATLGILVAAFIILRFLQFSHRRRMRQRRGRRNNYSVAPKRSQQRYRYK